jgi:hypothetical protein
LINSVSYSVAEYGEVIKICKIKRRNVAGLFGTPL